MTPALFLEIVLPLCAIMLGCGFILGHSRPSARLLDETWEEGYDTGRVYQRRLDLGEAVSDFTIPDDNAEPVPVLEGRIVGTDTGTIFDQNNPSFWYPENQERLHRHGLRAVQEPPEPEPMNPDTWLHDQLTALYDWSAAHRARQARWVGKTIALPIPATLPDETVKEIAS